MKINYICTHCGSSDVCFDAYAKWNTKTQDFEIYTTFEETWCRECDGENKCKTIDLAESSEGAAPCTD
jgi:hypothetical protein